MFRFDSRKSFFLTALSFAFANLAIDPARAQINLGAGDVALIGWIDNGTPSDAFALVALGNLPAGTTIYFTDNGWDGVSGGFRNTNGPQDGNGNETLLMLTVNTPVAAGTILDSTQTNPAFTWTTSGAIPGATSGTFGSLVLTQSGDQIYAFQHDIGQNPMNTPVQKHLFVLDDSGVFEDATTTGEGNVPPGLSVAGHTALTFPQSASTQNFMAFNTGALSSGTKAAWLAAIQDPANWTFGGSGTLPSGSIQVIGPAITAFCFGDGTQPTACPCANTGAPGHGCDNSMTTGGGLLTATGNTSPDSLVLTADDMVPSSSVLFLQAQNQIGSGVVFGDGVRCTSGVQKKLAIRLSGNGSASYPGIGDPAISARSAQLGDTIQPGSARYYQVLYRDRTLGFCPSPSGDTWNMTNGLQVVW